MGNNAICKECETIDPNKEQAQSGVQVRQPISLTIHKNTTENSPTSNNHIRIEILEGNRAKITY